MLADSDWSNKFMNTYYVHDIIKLLSGAIKKNEFIGFRGGNMKLKKSILKNSTYIRIFASYLCTISIIIIILGSILYACFAKTYNEQIMIMNNKLVEQQKGTIEEQYLKKLGSIYQNLSTRQTNPLYDKFIYFIQNSRYGKHADLLKMYDYLVQFSALYQGLLSSIHVFLPGSNTIVSTEYGIRYIDLITNPSETLDWYHYINNPPKKGTFIETRPLGNVFFPSNTQTGFSYIRAFPLFDFNCPDSGLLIIDVEDAVINEILNHSLTSDSDVNLVINDSGQVIFHSGLDFWSYDSDNTSVLKTLVKQSVSSGSYSTLIGGKKYMVSYSSFESANWRIASFLPTNVYYQNTAMILRKVIFCCAAIFIISIITTWFISQKMYNPLKTIVTAVKGIDKSCNNGYVLNNDYAIISNAISNLNSKLSVFQEDYQRNAPLLRQNFILSLLLNSVVTENNYLSMSETAQTSFRYQYFNCLILRLDCIPFISDSPREFSDSHKLLKEVESVFETRFDIYPVILSQSLLGLLINAPEDDNHSILLFYENLIAYLETSHKFELTSSVGGWQNTPLSSYVSYEQAKETMQYQFYYPDSKLLFYHNFVFFSQNNNHSSSVCVKDFTSALRRMDLEKAEKTIDDIIDNLLLHNNSIPYCNKQLIQLIDDLYEYAAKLVPNTLPTSSELFEEFSELSNRYIFKDWMLQYIVLVFEAVENKHTCRNSTIISEAKQYMAQHVDYNLTLDSVAAYSSFNPKYFSKIFKEQTGTNFQDYVTELRINKAIGMLKNTSKSIDQIAKEIGYNSSSYFIKQFKLVYDITPSTYRANLKKTKTSVLTDSL